MDNKQKQELSELAKKIETEIGQRIATHPEDGTARQILKLARGCLRLLEADGDSTIDDRVNLCLLKYCPEDAMFGVDHDLKKDLGLGSLDMATLLFDLEEEFNISITEEAFEKVETVKDVIDLVGQRSG